MKLTYDKFKGIEVKTGEGIVAGYCESHVIIDSEKPG